MESEDVQHTVQEPTPSQEDVLDAGEMLFTWETWEYPPIERTGTWYAIATLLGIGCLLYALFTANYIFAVLIVLFAMFIMMRDIRKPARMQTYLTTEGIIFNNRMYPFQSMRDFSIAYNPPTIKNLYVTFSGTMQPPLSIPLEDTDPNLVRAALSSFLKENIGRDYETLTDTLRRVYKL